MFQTLLESRASGVRSEWGTAVSIVVHTIAIALAIVATARATGAPPIQEPVPADITWASPTRPPAPPSTYRRVSTTEAIRHVSDIVWSRVTTIDLPTPPRSIGSIKAPEPAAFGEGATPLARGLAREDPRAPFDGADKVYELPMVEKGAAPQPGNPAPLYPVSLRAAQLDGTVVARFIVDTSGRAEPASIAFPEASHPAFAEAVRQALLRSRYLPATVRGRPVRQLVQQRFSFALQNFQR